MEPSPCSLTKNTLLKVCSLITKTTLLHNLLFLTIILPFSTSPSIPKRSLIMWGLQFRGSLIFFRHGFCLQRAQHWIFISNEGSSGHSSVIISQLIDDKAAKKLLFSGRRLIAYQTFKGLSEGFSISSDSHVKCNVYRELLHID